MDEGRINELLGKVVTLRGEIAHAAAEYAKVGGDPQKVGVTASEVATGLVEAIREIVRMRSSINRMRESAEVAMAAHGEVGNILDTLSRGGYVDETGAEVVELEDEDERPASSKTEPAPPLLEEEPAFDHSTEAFLPFDPVQDNPAPTASAEDRTLPLLEAPASPTMHAPADTAIPARKPDPTDATAAGRKRAAEAELLVSEWTPSTALISELGIDPEWAKGEGLDSFRARMDQSIRLARWGHRFKAWVLANPDQVKRKAS